MVGINENEKHLVESLVLLESNLYNILLFLMEEYGVDSYYDNENNLFVILQLAINESIDLARAEQYAINKVEPGLCEIVIKSK